MCRDTYIALGCSFRSPGRNGVRGLYMFYLLEQVKSLCDFIEISYVEFGVCIRIRVNSLV